MPAAVIVTPALVRQSLTAMTSGRKPHLDTNTVLAYLARTWNPKFTSDDLKESEYVAPLKKRKRSGVRGV